MADSRNYHYQRVGGHRDGLLVGTDQKRKAIGAHLGDERAAGSLRNWEVRAIHDYSGYRQVRELLARQYNLGDKEPNIQVVRVDVRGDRSLTLQHTQHARRPLGDSTEAVLKHFHRLWRFPVRLESTWNDEIIETRYCPEPAESAA